MANFSLIYICFICSGCFVLGQNKEDNLNSTAVTTVDSLETNAVEVPLGPISDVDSMDNKFIEPVLMKEEITYELSQFFDEDSVLDHKVEQTFLSLTDKQRVGQMIVNAAGEYGWPKEVILEMVRNQELGGVLLLNGQIEEFQQIVRECDAIVENTGGLPLMYSADAEPSLINRKVRGTPKIPATSDLDSIQQVKQVAINISKELINIGIHQNFAPVLDVSTNNAAIKNRSFGSKLEEIVPLAKAFALTTQEQGIVATAKHFPGHGLVEGDTHSKLVYIDGSFPELSAYPPLIDSGVISILVGHIAVKNTGSFDTNGYPASCSEVIVQRLLKDSLGFKGLVVTDAMNMGALKEIPKANLKAMQAGCDVILMPGDTKAQAQLITDALALMKEEEAFRQSVYESVRKIIRLKYCLNLF